MSAASVLSCHDICYDVKLAGGLSSCCRPKNTKRILSSISGRFPPGLNAILGPTGSGKTTLLDLLAGRKDTSGLTGEVLFNGAKQPDNFKCKAGYVVQADTVMGTLTVRENLRFSAALRLPSSIPASIRESRVQETLVELGLAELADSLVGTEFIRGISGGERKRTNIGMELITSPAVLFLDEPSTGLDASTANAVMLLLKKLAVSGKTIIFSIHQPRFSIYKLFDRLTLLSQGQLVYHGSASETLEHFSTLGHVCEEHNNPPDFFLDVINGDSSAVSGSAAGKSDGAARETEQTIATQLSAAFHASKWMEILTAELKAMRSSEESVQNSAKNGAAKIVAPRERVSYMTSPLRQTWLVSKRTVLNLVRNPMSSVVQNIVMVIFALIVGLIYFQLGRSFSTFEVDIQNRIGAFFFIIMNMVFSNMSAVELFIQERVLFIHESGNGFYRVSAYFLAKVICDIIPMRAIPTVIFSGIIYYMIGFRPGFDHFCIFYLTLFLTMLAGTAIAFWFSAAVTTLAIANLMLALSFVFMMVFGGLLLNVDKQIGEWARWLKYLSAFRYGFQGLCINELKGLQFCNGTGTLNHTVPCLDGTATLDSLAIKHSDPIDLWINHIALGAISVGFLFIAYIQLRLISKVR